MSVVVDYNSIRLHHCTTKRFEQQTVYDDSGTDYLYTKFLVHVVGYVHANLFASISNNTGVRTETTPTNPAYGNFQTGQASFVHGAAQNFNVIRTQLAMPRRSFTMSVGCNDQGLNGTVLLSADPILRQDGKNINYRDVNNGPKPQKVSITQLAGDAVFRVEFEIEVCRVECSADGLAQSNNGTGVLSHRWSMTDEIDNNFYCTRTITGRLRVATANLNPHSFRQLVMPVLQKYFRRERISFTATADNLNLDYTIVDREIAFAAPLPASSWHVSFQESSASAQVAETTINIRLAGARNVNKQTLVLIAAQIIDSRGIKIQLGRNLPDGAVFFREVTFTDVYGDTDNYIEAHAVIAHAGGDQMKDASDILGAISRRIGKPLTGQDIPGAIGVPRYDYETSLDPIRVNPRGEQAGPTGIAGVFAAYLQTACDTPHSHYLTKFSAVNEGGAAPSQSVAITSNVLPKGLPLPENVSTSKHQEYPYSFFQMQSTYEDKSTNVQVPLATEKPGYNPYTQPPASTGQSSSTNSGSVSGATSTVVRLGGGTPKLMIRVAAERIGQWPDLPNPSHLLGGVGGVSGTAIANKLAFTLLDSIVIPEAPTLTVDGKKLFRSHMQATIAISRPLKLGTESIPVGRAPWIKSDKTPNKTDPKMYNAEMFPLLP